MSKKEYDKGYKEAIEAIKKALNSNGGGGASGSGSMDPRLQPPPVGQQGNQQKGNQQNSQQGNQQNQQKSGSGNGNSRTSPQDQNQGVVRPEDCIGPDQLSNIPDTPGITLHRL